jgi:hypothetical protein
MSGTDWWHKKISKRLLLVDFIVCIDCSFVIRRGGHEDIFRSHTLPIRSCAVPVYRLVHVSFDFGYYRPSVFCCWRACSVRTILTWIPLHIQESRAGKECIFNKTWIIIMEMMNTLSGQKQPARIFSLWISTRPHPDEWVKYSVLVNHWCTRAWGNVLIIEIIWVEYAL